MAPITHISPARQKGSDHMNKLWSKAPLAQQLSSTSAKATSCVSNEFWSPITMTTARATSGPHMKKISASARSFSCRGLTNLPEADFEGFSCSKDCKAASNLTKTLVCQPPRLFRRPNGSLLQGWASQPRIWEYDPGSTLQGKPLWKPPPTCPSSTPLAV